MRFLAVLLVLLGCDVATASACSPRRQPEHMVAGEYRAVVVGEVTGIRLTDYEALKLGETELLPSGTMGRFMVDRVLDGSAGRTEVLQVGGCSPGVPGLRERGIFLIPKHGSPPFAVWESTGSQYSRLLKVAENISGRRRAPGNRTTGWLQSTGRGSR